MKQSHLIKALLALLYLQTFASSLSVRKECLVHNERKKELPWSGSHINLTTWIPEDPNDMRLSLTLELDERGNVKDHFEIHRNNISIVHSSPDIFLEQSLELDPPISHGWADFSVVATKDFQLHYKGLEAIATLEKKEENGRVHTIDIIGNNLTVNCHQLDLGWEIEKAKTVHIPLTSNTAIYNFSIFSNDPIKPVIKIGEQETQLGSNGNNLVDITIIKSEHQKPLRASIQYFFIISCYRQSGQGVKCKGEGGVDMLPFKDYDLMDSWPPFLEVKSDANTFVYFHRPPPPVLKIITTEVTLPTSAPPVSVGYVATTVFLVLICLALGGAIVYLVLKGKTTFSNKDIENQLRTTLQDVVSREVRPLLDQSPTPSVTSVSRMEPLMFNAVVENDARYVEFLLQRGMDPMNTERGRTTTPFIEAHILGRSEILQVLSLNKGEEPTMPSNDLINEVLRELTKRINDVFLAANYGMYEQDRGVKLQLEGHSLPGTVRDPEGRSLVHYMASKSFMDGRPAWEMQHIECFFQNHEYVINAINQWGNTALHELAQRKREEDKIVFWNGKEQSLSTAWLALAECLLQNGCDPRITNHQGLSPHDLATDKGNHDMSKLFKSKCDELGPTNLEESLRQFDDLVNAAKQGDTHTIRTLLRDHVPTLPPSAHFDPLVEAIRHNQREVVFLLLGAGSPLCNRSILDLTPLEIAHSTLGIPACFPALMRKAYIDRLQAEISRVSDADRDLKALRKGMEDYQKQLKEHGINSKWSFEAKTNYEQGIEARNILVQASRLGLSLTCQLLSLEDVYLHALPGEVKSFAEATSNKHVDTQFVLYRDLKMSPYTFPSASLEHFSPMFSKQIVLSEFTMLEKMCFKSENPELHGQTGQKILQCISELKTHPNIFKGCPQDDMSMDVPPYMLYLLAKQGLDTILNILLTRNKNIDINDIVEPFSKCTCLHVAAMYGEIDMVEFLLYNGANVDLISIGGFTAAHLAALWGHKDCLQYIEAYMKDTGKDSNKRCKIGLTAQEIQSKYEQFCNASPFPKLQHETALQIMSTRGEDTQACEMLKEKSKILNIHDAKSLSDCALREKATKQDCDTYQNQAADIAELICSQINEPVLQGTIISAGHLYEGNDLFSITSAHTMYQLSKLHALGEDSTISCNDVVKNDTDTAVEIMSQLQQDLFNGGGFVKTFSSAIKRVIGTDNVLPAGISIAPPFVRSDFKGIYIFTVWLKNKEIIPMRIRIVPCLRAESPPDSRVKSLPQKFHAYINEDDCVHLHLRNLEGEWLYRGYNCERFVFSNLDENQKTVWLCIRLVLVLLDSVWWAPSFNTKKYKKPWHTMSLGVDKIHERTAKALFLKELAECQDWGESNVFDRVYGIFERSVTKDIHGNWIPKETVNSFITPRHYCSKVGKSVPGIMQFLDDMKRRNNSILPVSSHLGDWKSDRVSPPGRKRVVGFNLSQ